MAKKKETPVREHVTMTHEEWQAKGTALFGEDQFQWKFVCPSCGHVAAVVDWKNAGAKIESAAFSCVGRWLGADDKKTFEGKGGPCTYAGGGLFGLNPVTVHKSNGTTDNYFAFAE